MTSLSPIHSIFFELPDLEIYEPAYHEKEILEQLKAEEWGLA